MIKLIARLIYAVVREYRKLSAAEFEGGSSCQAELAENENSRVMQPQAGQFGFSLK